MSRVWIRWPSRSLLSPVGRRNLEVLNKSAIVLLCAIWEAYCEDLADDALRLLGAGCFYSVVFTNWDLASGVDGLASMLD